MWESKRTRQMLLAGVAVAVLGGALEATAVSRDTEVAGTAAIDPAQAITLPVEPVPPPDDRIDFTLHVPVLMYHRITRAPADAALPGLWVSPRLFERQLRALKRQGWRTITAAQLARHLRARRPIARRRLVITIDDGAVDGYRNAAPILDRLGMQGTFCVNP